MSPRGRPLRACGCAMSDTVTVLLFAGARETVGAPVVTVDLGPGATAGDVLTALCARYPALVPYVPSLRVAVNGAYARSDEPVHAGDEVAVIPPVAGG